MGFEGGMIRMDLKDLTSQAKLLKEVRELALAGNKIEAIWRFSYPVFKFSPEGRYQNRFGSEGEGNGKFRAPYSIAVDSYGRVFVSDIWGVQVFDSQGLYIETFDDTSASSVIFDMAINSQNNLYAASNKPQVIKFDIKKPQ